ncbi:MAG: hypothetical protein CSA26_09760 [Desulfobacterales bacterium]|nr:MAG: hypothetical protein CSA26_09760 [Desulfobacterales bacterium]
MKQRIYMPPITIFLGLFSILSFCCIVAAHGAESVDALQWDLTADKLIRYENPPAVIAEGNVVLEKKKTVTRKTKEDTSDWSDLLGEDADSSDKRDSGARSEGQEPGAGNGQEKATIAKVLTTIKADWMVYDADLGRIKARGNLLIDVGPDQLAAESGIVELEQETGIFENATIIRQYKDMHLEGRVIEKTGDLTYHIEDGWIITCKLKDGETPPWSFAVADAEITDGGYAFLKHATFRIKGVPVLYTPYMILPAKRKRQTGFLFPSISKSDQGGVGVELPFFINLSPSSDITLYPQYIADRGLMLGGEFRYVVDSFDKGIIMANYLSDDLSDPSQTDYYNDTGYTHTNQDRYWIRAKADQDVGKWTARLDIDLVSDKDYLDEFNTGLTGFTTSNNRFKDVFGRGFQGKTINYRKNSLEVLRSFTNGSSLQGELLLYDDLNDPDSVPSRLWKLPSLSYTGLVPLYEGSDIDLSWDADYVHYWRESGVGAHRFDIHPQLSMGIPLSTYLETTVGVGVRDTFYAINVNGDENDANVNPSGFSSGDSENRLLFDFNAEVGSTMIGDFSIHAGNVNGWSHMFRPYISYAYVSDDDQDDLPNFDSVDRIGDKNVVYLGFDNFFDISGERNGNAFERRYGFFKIKQGYDFRSEQSDTPLTDIDIELGYYPTEKIRLTYTTDIDVYSEGAYAHTVEADFKSDRGDRLSADYTLNTTTDTNSISLDTWLVLPYNFFVGYGIERSLEDEVTVEENIRFLYQPACWSVEFLSHKTEYDQTYLIMFRLANIGNSLGLNLPGS